MKIFISWSGERSKRVGLLLQGWLKCVLQACDPWISDDIDRGAYWRSDINEALHNCVTGIVCLTAENLNAPWLLFEAGALANNLHFEGVCTFLVDIGYADIKEPLTAFNHTTPHRESVFKLVETLNKKMEHPLGDQTLAMVFETYWDRFDKDFHDILQSTPMRTPSADAKKTQREMTAEILTSVRNMPQKDMAAEILASVRNMEKRLQAFESWAYPQTVYVERAPAEPDPDPDRKKDAEAAAANPIASGQMRFPSRE